MIKEQYIKIGTSRRSGIKMQAVTFFVDHDTGNPNSTAQNNVDYYCRSCNEMSASAHAFIDDKGVIICIPCRKDDKEKAWHVRYDKTEDNRKHGADANDNAIGMELCFFPTDKARSLKAYQNYVTFAAMMCIEHGVDPHNRSGHFQLDPERRSDPKTALVYVGKTYPDMVEDIVKEVEAMKMEVKPIRIKLNGAIKTVNAVMIEGNNYVKLQDLKDHYIDVSYDIVSKMPDVDSRASR